MKITLNNLHLEPFAEVLIYGNHLAVYAGWVSVSLDADGLSTGDLLSSARFKVKSTKGGIHAFKAREFDELFSICDAFIKNRAPEVISSLSEKYRHKLAKEVVFEITKAILHEQLKAKEEFTQG